MFCGLAYLLCLSNHNPRSEIVVKELTHIIHELMGVVWVKGLLFSVNANLHFYRWNSDPLLVLQMILSVSSPPYVWSLLFAILIWSKRVFITCPVHRSKYASMQIEPHCQNKDMNSMWMVLTPTICYFQKSALMTKSMTSQGKE